MTLCKFGAVYRPLVSDLRSSDGTMSVWVLRTSETEVILPKQAWVHLAVGALVKEKATKNNNRLLCVINAVHFSTVGLNEKKFLATPLLLRNGQHCSSNLPTSGARRPKECDVLQPDWLRLSFTTEMQCYLGHKVWRGVADPATAWPNAYLAVSRCFTTLRPHAVTESSSAYRPWSICRSVTATANLAPAVDERFRAFVSFSRVFNHCDEKLFRRHPLAITNWRELHHPAPVFNTQNRGASTVGNRGTGRSTFELVAVSQGKRSDSYWTSRRQTNSRSVKSRTGQLAD